MENWGVNRVKEQRSSKKDAYMENKIFFPIRKKRETPSCLELQLLLYKDAESEIYNIYIEILKSSHVF